MDSHEGADQQRCVFEIAVAATLAATGKLRSRYVRRDVGVAGSGPARMVTTDCLPRMRRRMGRPAGRRRSLRWQADAH
jgi:hypothetical protein